MAEPGDINRHGQELVRKTTMAGNHSNQRVWVLRSTDPSCGHVYGANGCDFHIRRCPAHQRGAPGLDVEK